MATTGGFWAWAIRLCTSSPASSGRSAGSTSTAETPYWRGAPGAPPPGGGGGGGAGECERLGIAADDQRLLHLRDVGQHIQGPHQHAPAQLGPLVTAEHTGQTRFGPLERLYRDDGPHHHAGSPPAAHFSTNLASLRRSLVFRMIVCASQTCSPKSRMSGRCSWSCRSITRPASRPR